LTVGLYPVTVTKPQVAETTETQELRQACLAAVAAARSEPNLESAYRTATVLGEVAKALGRDAAVLRAEIAQSLLQRDHLSLSQLAERLGVSKARADQMNRMAKSVQRGDT
jgi:hypothetical protein